MPTPAKLLLELELKLIQTQTAQKPVLRAEVQARALGASQNVKRAEVWVYAPASQLRLPHPPGAWDPGLSLVKKPLRRSGMQLRAKTAEPQQHLLSRDQV
jgi:hypothetical protein